MSLPRALLGCAPFVPAGMLFVGRSVGGVCVCVRSGGRGWRFWDVDRLRVCFFKPKLQNLALTYHPELMCPLL